MAARGYVACDSEQQEEPAKDNDRWQQAIDVLSFFFGSSLARSIYVDPPSLV